MSYIDDEAFYYDEPDVEEYQYTKVVHSTEKAILFENSKQLKFWIPKSMISHYDIKHGKHYVYIYDTVTIKYFNENSL